MRNESSCILKINNKEINNSIMYVKKKRNKICKGIKINAYKVKKAQLTVLDNINYMFAHSKKVSLAWFN